MLLDLLLGRLGRSLIAQQYPRVYPLIISQALIRFSARLSTVRVASLARPLLVIVD